MLLFSGFLCVGCSGDGGDRAGWLLGGRLLHLHQQREPSQLLCGRRDCHRVTLGQVSPHHTDPSTTADCAM